MVAEKTTAFWLGFYQGFTVASQTLRKPIPYFARPLPCAAHSSFRQLSTHTHTHTHTQRTKLLSQKHSYSLTMSLTHKQKMHTDERIQVSSNRQGCCGC